MELKTQHLEYNIDELVREAQIRWLKPAEVFFILQNHEKHPFTEVLPHKPQSGALFLYNKRVMRSFRRDGHSWRRKRDGKAVGEAHERLKVGNTEALSCYYAHGEENPNFQRRSYWMLDPVSKDIVLVHYRDVNEGLNSCGTPIQSSPGSTSNFSQVSDPYISPSSATSGLYQPYQNSWGPGTTEGGFRNDSSDHVKGADGGGGFCASIESEVMQALRKLEQQLSLDDESSDDMSPFCIQKESLHESEVSISHQNTNLMSDFNLLGSNTPHPYNVQGNGSSSSDDGLSEEGKNSAWFAVGSNNVEKGTTSLLSQELDCSRSCSNSSLGLKGRPDCGTMFDDKITAPTFGADPSFAIVKTPNSVIHDISPEWGYATESTKVIIVGHFLRYPSSSSWVCIIDDIEVPLQVIQEGVFLCHAPPHKPGKVGLCITSNYTESCSQVREFEYRAKPDSTSDTASNMPYKSLDEQLLLVRLAQLLLSDADKKRNVNSSRNDEDMWSHMIEDILFGKGYSGNIMDRLLQELLRDKLKQWLPFRGQQLNHLPKCSLSKKEQGIIHMVAGLGFEWALKPILSCGVGVNFRDINGWTALHWAARFGREKTVAALIASGASAGAVTDPNSQDSMGRTAASIAASLGHNGLAGYLSELTLTTHLSSLDNCELPRGISKTTECNDDHLPCALAAVRNAAQAAARIQSAFRAHSFRRRQQLEASSVYRDDIRSIPIASKLACDGNSAALSIQKRYQGWRGRKTFLDFRQKVVKIQAYVRGHQVRKKYKVICWAVGVLEKVVLRWRRKGAGLRGFRPELMLGNESEDDDVIKVFRKEKVEVGIDEDVTRVRSMVESPEARLQYGRMLERFSQAKEEFCGMSCFEDQLTEAGNFMDSELWHM